MKKIYLILCLAALAAGGCISPKTLPEQAKEMEEGNADVGDSQENGTAQEREKIAEETHLELIRLVDCAPFYSMSFQKIEGGTGELLLFEGNTEISDQKTAGPDNVELEPEAAVCEVGYAFDGDENLADTVTLSFWNRGEAESIQVILDGLEYELSCPKMNPEEIRIEQNLGETEIVLEDVKIYPKALLLRLSGINSANWDKSFFLSYKENEERVLPVRSVCEMEAGEMYLLFTFENGVPEKLPAFRMVDSDAKEDELFLPGV